jgi:hypothetical protein
MLLILLLMGPLRLLRCSSPILSFLFRNEKLFIENSSPVCKLPLVLLQLILQLLMLGSGLID